MCWHIENHLIFSHSCRYVDANETRSDTHRNNFKGRKRDAPTDDNSGKRCLSLSLFILFLLDRMVSWLWLEKTTIFFQKKLLFFFLFFLLSTHARMNNNMKNLNTRQKHCNNSWRRHKTLSVLYAWSTQRSPPNIHQCCSVRQNQKTCTTWKKEKEWSYPTKWNEVRNFIAYFGRYYFSFWTTFDT